MFNSGIRGRRAKDGEGVVNPQAGFVQKTSPQPYISGYTISGIDDTALDPAGGQTIIVSGTGFATGVSATLGGTQIGAVSLISSTQISFTSPAKSAGSYALLVYNSTGGAAILVPGITYSSIPTFTTAAGSIGSIYETTSLNTSVVATSDSTLTYSLDSGILPAGATLSSDGTITGTAPLDSGSTTYTFSIKATDTELQDVTRTFTLTVNTDVVTWVTPSNGAIINLDGSLYSQTLSASDAASQLVTYTANSLPEGLTLTSGTISGTPTVAGTVNTLLTATASTTNRFATNTITWVVNLGDVNWKYTSLLVTGLTPTTSFINDASLNNNQLTIVGDVKPNNFIPYTLGYYSNYFDGTGDQLTLSSSSELEIGTGQFTIEFWIQFKTVVSLAEFVQSSNDTTSGRFVIYFNGSAIQVVANGGAGPTSISWTPVTGRWYHIAASRDSSNAQRLFIDGELKATATSTNNYTQNGFVINKNGAFNGYLSNFRLIKGSAVYTSTFTPSTSPLEPLPGTRLLTCQSASIVDNSWYNFTITKVGDVLPTLAHPFSLPTSVPYNTQYSTSFDGTGDGITIPSNAAFSVGTGDFTVEAWINPRTWGGGFVTIFAVSATNGLYFGGMGGSIGLRAAGVVNLITTTAPTLNTWTHVAASRQGTSLRLFVNGALSNTVTDSTNFAQGLAYIGGDSIGNFPFNGAISNVRLVKGTALYTGAFTPSIVPLTTSSQGATPSQVSLLTCQDATLKDNSINNFSLTSYNQTQPVAVSPFTMTTSSTTVTSLGSTYFDGTGDYLSIPASPGFTFTGDFTIEAWVYPTALGADNCIISQWTTSLSFILKVVTGNRLYFAAFPGSIVTQGTTTTVPLNQWSHVAVTRTGTTIKLFVNGVQDATTGTVSGSLNASTSAVTIGSLDTTPSQLWTGYINNLRVNKGTALYTANFLPPQAPLTAVTNTTLLTCQNNGGANNNGFVDQSSSNNIITRTGNITQGTFSPYSSTSWSNYFNGSSYFYGPASMVTSAGMGTGFSGNVITIETWIYATTLTGSNTYTAIIGAYAAAAANGRYWFGFSNAGNLTFTYTTGTGSEDNIVAPTTGFTANQWHHIAVTIDATTNTNTTVNMFLNGTRIVNATGKNFSTQTTYYDRPYIGGNYSQYVNSFTGYLSNFRISKGVAVYTNTYTPSTTPFAVTANTVLLTYQDNVIVDNSPNQFVLPLMAGTASVQAFSPFNSVTSVPTSYSYAFDGTNDRLAFPSSSAFNLGTTYTVEGWIYLKSYPSAWNRFVMIGVNGNTTGWLFSVGTTGILDCGSPSVLGAVVNQNIVSGTTVPLNTWVHVAVARDSSSARMYANGVLVGSNTSPATQTAGNVDLYLGYDTASTVDGQLNGFMSNFRVVKGTAVYTTAFTPPTAPLTAIADTVLLTGQSNRLVDNSVNNFAVTVTNDVKPTKFNPFGTTTTTSVSYTPSVNSGSMYFDGTGDYLTLPTSTNYNLTGDFTFEAWVYPTSQLANAFGVFDARVNGGTAAAWVTGLTNTSGYKLEFFNGTSYKGTITIPLNQWVHVAWTRSGSALASFVNGVRDYYNAAFGTAAISPGSTAPRVGTKDNGIAGYETAGYISDLRLINGTAMYTSSFVPPVSPVTPTNNTILLLNGTSGGVIDYHGTSNLETVGNTQLAGEDPYAGSYYSNYFDGTGDYLTTASNTAFNMDTGDFTIECFVNTNGYAGSQYGRGIFALYPSGNYNNRVILRHTTADNRLNLYGAIGGSAFLGTSGTDGTIALSTGAWTHVALVRQSGVFRLYINGVQDILISNQTSVSLATLNCFDIGRTQEGSLPDWNGYISNFRVIKGTCLYPDGTAFTRPSSLLSAISGTSLLTCQTNKFVDTSGNAIALTTSGNVSVKSMNPFRQNTGKSLYFDGTGDYLVTRNDPINALTSDFTIEMWFNASTLTSTNSNSVGLLFIGDSTLNDGRLQIAITTTGGTYFYMRNNSAVDVVTVSSATGLVVPNSWYHLVNVRSGNTFTTYLNGVSVATATSSTAMTYASNVLNIGFFRASNLLQHWNGYIKDLRITKGIARYSTTFTPPALPVETK